MKTRILSSVAVFAIIAIAIASRLLTPYVFDAIFLIAGVVGTIEVTRAYSNNKKTINSNMTSTYMPVLYIGLLYVIFTKGTLLHMLLYVGCMVVAYFLFSIFLSLLSKEDVKAEMLRNGYLKSFARYIFAKAFRTIAIIFYPAVLFMCLIVLNHLESFYIVTEETTIKSITIFLDYMIIACFVCSTLTDTFAMLIGCKVGGPKLCPNISPKKTVSGAISGLLFGIIGVLGLYMIYSTNETFVGLIEGLKVNWLPVISFAVVAPILCQVGDICASAIKRKNNIKDYGTLIPGHGGVMDRMDGQIFVGAFALIISICVCL